MEESEDRYADRNLSMTTTEFMSRLQLAPTHGHILQIINEGMPEWIIHACDDYAKDCDKLKRNWYLTCRKIGCPVAQVVIVRDMHFDNEHSLMKVICEVMTRCGYAVRDRDTICRCVGCGNATLTKLTREKFSLAEVLEEHCEDCSKKSS